MWPFLVIGGAFAAIAIFSWAVLSAAKRSDEIIDGLIEANKYRPIEGMAEPIHERFRM